jgi:hypothetical protein
MTDIAVIGEPLTPEAGRAAEVPRIARKVIIDSDRHRP